VRQSSIVSDSRCELLIQHTIHADRANDGLLRTETAEDLQDLDPTPSRIQALNSTRRTMKRAEGRLKPRPVKAQKSTTKRSQCTVAQQFRWFKNVRKGMDFLSKNNTGVCRKTGKTFGELINHFIVGTDKSCLMVDSSGKAIVGEVGQRKHKKKRVDYRGSISMLQTGSTTGSNGPTLFLMQGKRRNSVFSDGFLMANGAAEGSTVVTTDNAFMTEDAWESVAPKGSVYLIYFTY